MAVLQRFRGGCPSDLTRSRTSKKPTSAKSASWQRANSSTSRRVPVLSGALPFHDRHRDAVPQHGRKRNESVGALALLPIDDKLKQPFHPQAFVRLRPDVEQEVRPHAIHPLQLFAHIRGALPVARIRLPAPGPFHHRVARFERELSLHLLAFAIASFVLAERIARSASCGDMPPGDTTNSPPAAVDTAAATKMVIAVAPFIFPSLSCFSANIRRPWQTRHKGKEPCRRGRRERWRRAPRPSRMSP